MSARVPATSLRATAVHEAGHAVIGRVIGYDIASITVVPKEGEYLGIVHTRGVRAFGEHLLPQYAVYCLAGMVAMQRVCDDFDAYDYIGAHNVDDAGMLVQWDIGDDREIVTLPAEDNDLLCAWDAIGRDWSSLMDAYDRTCGAVRTAWRRIDAVARHLERVGTVEDGGDRYALRDLLHGRGDRWYSRTHDAIHGREHTAPTAAALPVWSERRARLQPGGTKAPVTATNR